jgi:hypothetical protein
MADISTHTHAFVISREMEISVFIWYAQQLKSVSTDRVGLRGKVNMIPSISVHEHTYISHISEQTPRQPTHSDRAY